MAAAVYYLPDAPSSLLTSIESTLRALHARLLPTRFTLEHRLFRSVPALSPPPGSGSSYSSATPKASLQHILTLSHRAPSAHLFAHPQDDASGGCVIGIAAANEKEWREMLIGKMSGLWTNRAALAVAGGEVWGFGDWVVRLGEVRTLGANSQPRGVVVVISEEDSEGKGEGEDEDMTEEGGDENGVDKKQTEVAAATAMNGIRDVWEKLGVKGARETMGKIARGKQGKIEAEVRMWCEVLKLRN